MTLSKRKMAVVAPVASICIFILLWELVSLNVSAEFLPSPLAVVKEAVRLFHANISGTSLIGHIGWSLSRVLIAFFLAIVLGLPLGLYMGWSRIFEKIISPIFEVLRPIPPIAWIPIAILWLGVAEGSKIFICFVGAFVIMMIIMFILGMFIDWLGIVMIVFPIFLPIMDQFGFDRLWLVAVSATLLQTCFMTPPFGFALFYVKGILPDNIKIQEVYKGVIPFIIIICIVTALCAVFPPTCGL